MNNQRRKALREAAELLERAQSLADEAAQIVGDVCDEERDAFDNLPESLQQAERGEAMQSAISLMEGIELEDVFADALSAIEEAAA